MPDETRAPDHISDVRRILMDQLRAVRAADSTKLNEEIERSRAVVALSQTLVHSAAVEVEYLRVVKGAEAPFLQTPDEEDPGGHPPVREQSALPTSDADRLGGPGPDHPWRSRVHRLRG